MPSRLSYNYYTHTYLGEELHILLLYNHTYLPTYLGGGKREEAFLSVTLIESFAVGG